MMHMQVPVQYTSAMTATAAAYAGHRNLTTVHHTAFVACSVTAKCSLSSNTHKLPPVLCCLTVVTF